MALFPLGTEERFTLSAGDVHIWHADLGLTGNSVDPFRDVLDDEERARTERLRVPDDRAQFLAAHVIARLLIGRYLSCPPALVRFARAATGKPYLAGPEPRCDLRFNASRTRGYAAFAFALGRDVGIDVERKEMLRFAPELYVRALSRREQDLIRSLPDEGRPGQFYSFWVGKEAVLKARGDGMAVSPASIDLATPGEPARFPDDLSRAWRVENLALDPAVEAAVAMEGSDWRVRSIRNFAADADQLA